MEFTLRYAGPLGSGQARSAQAQKSTLRAEFSQQLKELWSTHPTLAGEHPTAFARHEARASRKSAVDPPVLYMSELWGRYCIEGVDYVPLVHYGHRTHCQLAIRLFSKRDFGGIIHGGADLDNRLKVILDALTLPPHHKTDRVGDLENSESVTFCLLQDDELVTKLSIETRVLLRPAPTPNYVEVDIDVRVIPTSPVNVNLRLLVP